MNLINPHLTLRSFVRSTVLVFLLFANCAVVKAQFVYTTNGSEITITGYTGPGGDIVIPDGITGLPVTTIGDSAFNGVTNLTSVVVTNTITRIGMFAFESCNSLTNVAIAGSVTNIGDWAFDNCPGLINVVLTNGLLRLGYGSFSSCSGLTNLTIPASVTVIDGYAFGYCTALTNLAIPASVTNIGDQVCLECSKLTAVNADPLNPAFSSLAGVLFNKNQTALLLYPKGKSGSSYAITNGVTAIGNYAFAYCSSLTSVTIPNTVTDIGADAFVGCGNLQSAPLPTNVINIGTYAFASCGSLTNLTIPASVTSIGNYAFYRCNGPYTVDPLNPAYSSSAEGILFDNNKTTIIQVPINLTGSYIIPDTVTTIAISAFDFAYQLTSVTIPASVTSLGNYAFANAFNLTALYFQGNAPSLGSQALATGTGTIVYYQLGTTGWGGGFGGLATQPANPQTVMFRISGNLSSITGDTNYTLPGSITTTSAFSGTLSYNTGIIVDNAPADPNYGYYIYGTNAGGMSMNITVGTNVFTSVTPTNAPYDVFIIHKPPGTPYGELAWETVKIQVDGNPVPGADSTDIDVDFIDPGGTALATDLRPVSAPGLAKFSARHLNIYAGTNGSRLFLLFGNITNVTQILPPALTITRADTNAVVSWTALATGFVPEQSGVITGAWKTVNPPYQTNGDQVSFTVPATNGANFFRLHAP